MRGWKIGALILLIMGCLAVLVELESPTLVLWTGQHVEGYSQNGLIYYEYKGVNYTTDNPGQSATDSRRIPKTVYFKSSDPTSTNIHGGTRWFDAFMVLIWFVGAGASLLAGVVHQRRRRKPRKATPGIFDEGGSLFSKQDSNEQGRNGSP